jgi:DNA-binding NarL/FixJ family response regulator
VPGADRPRREASEDVLSDRPGAQRSSSGLLATRKRLLSIQMSSFRQSPSDRRYCGLVTVVVGGFEPIFALGLVAVLDGDEKIRVLAHLVEFDACDASVRALAPRVVIVPAPEPHVVQRRLASLCGVGTVLLLADGHTLAYQQLVLNLGASCVDRGATPAAVLEAVHRVADEATPRKVTLTQRERDVLVCISEGKTHRQTAEELDIGLRTVHTYSARLCRKFNVSSRRDLVGLGWTTRVNR